MIVLRTYDGRTIIERRRLYFEMSLFVVNIDPRFDDSGMRGRGLTHLRRPSLGDHLAAMTDEPLTTKAMLETIPGLKLADRDWRMLAGMKNPMKVSIWLALMKTHEELESRGDFTHVLPGDDSEGSERVSIPAIVALGEVMVRRALKGDMMAINAIADRIEGRVGTRKGDVDEEDEKRRGDMGAAIEAVVTALTRAKLGEVIDVESLDITPTDSPRGDPESSRDEPPPVRIHSPHTNGRTNGANGHAEDDHEIEIEERVVDRTRPRSEH